MGEIERDVIKKVSIISVVYNDVRLARALDSVLGQKVDCEVEIIVVSDETGEELEQVLKEYADRVTVIRNDTRQGIYGARNQGLGVATGDIVGFLNADDYYYNDQVLSRVVGAFFSPFRSEHPDVVSGNIKSITPDGRVAIYGSACDLESYRWKFDMHVPDPTLFYHRGVFERYGNYNESFDLCGDNELVYRLFYRWGVSHLHVNHLFTVFQLGGASSSGSYRLAVKMFFESGKSWHVNGVPPWKTTYFMWLRFTRYVIGGFGRKLKKLRRFVVGLVSGK